ADGGHAAIVLLEGDPGVGKSRLLYEFLQTLDGAGIVELETTCASYFRSMAYRPISELLRRHLALAEGVDREDLRKRVAEGLHAGDIRGMVRTLLVADDVSEELFKILVEKSEGNPLYVEEILRQLQETAGLVVEAGVARLRSTDVTVPATIHDIIAARVDRLAQQLKQTLQGAAVIGRRFGVSLVSRVLDVL